MAYKAVKVIIEPYPNADRHRPDSVSCISAFRPCATVSDSHRVLRGSIFVMASRVSSMITVILFSLVMARALGKDQYGLISIAVGVFGAVTIIGDMGLTVAAARYTAIHRKQGAYGEVKSILRATLLVKSIMAIGFMLILVLLSRGFDALFQKPVSTLVGIMGFSLLFNLPASAFQALMRGSHRMDLYAFTNMLRDAAWLVCASVLVYLGWGVTGAIVGHLVSQAVWFVSNAWVYFSGMYREIASSTSTKIGPTSKKLILFGITIISIDILIYLYNWSDTFIIGIFRPTWEVSCYNIAFGMINVVMVVIASANTAIFPLLCEKSVDKDVREITRIFNRLSRLLCTLVYPLLIFLILMQPFTVLIYGKEYLPAVLPLWILSIWGFARPFGAVSNTLLTALGRQKHVLYTTSMMAGANIVLNLVLVPLYGMNGAAIASTLSIGAGCVLSLFFVRQLESIRWNPRTPLFILSICAIAVAPIMGAAILLHRVFPYSESALTLIPTLIVLGFAYLCLYTWLLKRMGGIDSSDVAVLSGVVGSAPRVSRLIRWVLDRTHV